MVPKLSQLKDSQNNRKQMKCIPFSGCVSQSMWSRLQTDPASSQHIQQNLVILIPYLNKKLTEMVTKP